MKIRGNAQHVAEKYLQLARDAHTGGDPVAAENYLQHAEHYFRIIAAAQAAQALAQSGQVRAPGEAEGDDIEDDDDYSALSDRFASPSERAGASFQPPQNAFQTSRARPTRRNPSSSAPPFDPDRQGQNDRGGFQPRQDRQGNRFPDRGPRQDRQFGDRADGYRDNRQNRDGRPRDSAPIATHRRRKPPREGAPDAVSGPALPSFITGAVRPTVANSEPPPSSVADPQPTTDVEGNEAAAPAFGEQAPGGPNSPARPRRRRLRSPYGFNAAQTDQDMPEPAPKSDK